MRKAMLVAILIAAMAAPAFAANFRMTEGAAAAALDRVDDTLGLAMRQFYGGFDGQSWAPAHYTGGEPITVRGETRTSAQWFRAGFEMYEAAWDARLDGRHEDCVRYSNIAHTVFTILVDYQGR
ncbi:hypothetical protein K8I61_01070 [bacterium]|nr:hypothetical protein [bacterium]